MCLSNKALALVAVAGLALAGYAGAASSGLLPEGADMGMGMKARCARAVENAEGRVAEAPGLQRCQGLAARADGRGPGPRHGGERPGHPPLPPFQAGEGTVEGRWVAFEVDAEGHALRAYTSRGPWADAAIFDAVTLAPGSAEQDARVRGPLWVGKDGDVVVAAFNAPNAFLGVKNAGQEAATVTFDLADGVVAEAAEGGANLTRGDHRAGLRTLGNATVVVEGDLVTATLEPGGAVAFAIEGFPRLLQHELRVLRHLGQAGEERGPPPEDAEAP